MVHLPALLYPVRRRVSSPRRAALRRSPPCAGALWRGASGWLWGLQGARSRGAGAKVLLDFLSAALSSATRSGPE